MSPTMQEPALSNQIASTTVKMPLSELEERIRAAYGGAVAAFASGVDRALEAGRLLNTAKAETTDEPWGAVLRRCGIKERTAQQFIQFARLVDASYPLAMTVPANLKGLSIIEAIKRLSPPDPHRNTGRPASTPVVRPAASPLKKTTHTDIIAAWMCAPPDEHMRAVDSIGAKSWLNAVPREWYPQLEKFLAEQRQSMTITIEAEPAPASDDLSIPSFLKREVQAGEAQVVDSDALPGQAPADAAEEPDNKLDDEFDEPEPELKPKRKVKYVEQTSTLAEAVDSAFGDLVELASDCREVVDSTPEGGLQETYRYQAFEQSADGLESIEAPVIGDAIAALPVKYALPKRRYASRAARADDASTILEACVTALGNAGEADHAAAQALVSDLEDTISIVEGCDFPGMYG